MPTRLPWRVITCGPDFKAWSTTSLSLAFASAKGHGLVAIPRSIVNLVILVNLVKSQKRRHNRSRAACISLLENY